MTTINRINGLVSGFDTETLVRDLMKLERTKSYKVLRDTQTANWQKEGYREMMSLFRGMQSEFLDVLKPSSNMRSSTAFKLFSASAQLSGTATTKVSATTSTSSVAGTITIDSITQLATKDTWVSGSDVKPLEGTAVNLANVNAALATENSISMTLDGVTKSIDLDTGGYVDMAALVSDLNSKITTAFGAARVTVTDSGGQLNFATTGHTVTLNSGEGSLLTNLGFSASASNALTTSTTLSSAFGVTTDTLAFSINGVSSVTMGITQDDTIQSMMEKVNASSAGVTMSYSTFTNGFSMKSNKEGYANSIELTDTNSFFSDKLKLSTVTGRTLGQDAVFSINGVDTTRSENSVTIDGTTIQLKDTSAVEITVAVAPNTTAVKDNIVKFVNKYNDLIEKVYAKLDEERNRDYTPLVDEEKLEMSESNIELWESKAKSGLLRGDGILNSLMTKLRSAFSEAVTGAGITLSEMGITTSSNYKENGKLVVDESKLDVALSTKLTEVTAFFTQESDHAYGEAGTADTRYSENGLGARINDILNDNIRITRDNSGKKGLLVEKAGYEKASSDTASDLAKRIRALEDRYAILLEKMNNTENRYYAKFAAMESALSRMNAQSTSLSGMLSSGS